MDTRRYLRRHMQRKHRIRIRRVEERTVNAGHQPEPPDRVVQAIINDLRPIRELTADDMADIVRKAIDTTAY